MFCFPISDHIMVPQRTVSFKCHPMHVHPKLCLHNLWKDKDKFPGEHWKSKTYKLKRSIYVSSIIRCKNTSNQIKPQIGHIWWETHSGDHPRGRNTWALIKGWPQKKVCLLSDLTTILLADISNLLLNRGASIFIYFWIP